MSGMAILSDALGATPLVALPAALAWGLASIWLSPCHLAGVPLVVGWLATTPAARSAVGSPPATAVTGRRHTLIVLAFAFGILLSLLPLGAVALLLGRLAGDLGFSGNWLAALLCLVGGLYLLDWLPLPSIGKGLPQPTRRGPWTALLLGLVFGLALGPCAFAWIAPVLGVAGLQAAGGLILPALLLAMFALGHLLGVLLAAGSLSLVQRWLDALGQHRGLALGRAACGLLLLVMAGALIKGA
ncbi:MAG: cytochrome C biogenesis protein [Chromatiaceae bacterium]|nr:cytochrome C biogenesis protein [Chromatiaceae bacterium]